MKTLVKNTSKVMALSVCSCAIGLLVTLLIGAGLGAQVIPPTHILYDATNSPWLSYGRAVMHVIIAVCMLLMGSLMIASVPSRNSLALRIRGFLIGLVLLSSAVWQITVMGSVLWGGVWHWATFVSSTAFAINSIVTATIMFTTQKELNEATSE